MGEQEIAGQPDQVGKQEIDCGVRLDARNRDALRIRSRMKRLGAGETMKMGSFCQLSLSHLCSELRRDAADR